MSNNLELAQVAAAQNNKEVTINDQAGQLDAGLTDKVEVALTGTTSPLALSDAQAAQAQAEALMALDLIALDPATVSDTLGVLLKYQDDIARIEGSKAKELLDDVRAQLRAAE